MLRLTLALLAALAVTLTACDSDSDEDIPSTSPTIGEGTDIAVISPAPTSTTGGDITICPRIGVPGEATPSQPTPQARCDPGDDFTQIAPNIRGRLAEPPALPAGLIALTRYLEFETDTPNVGAEISIPMTGNLPIGQNPAWYSYEADQWQLLDVTPTIHQPSSAGSGAMAEGSFDPLPPNLILLAED